MITAQEAASLTRINIIKDVDATRKLANEFLKVAHADIETTLKNPDCKESYHCQVLYLFDNFIYNDTLKDFPILAKWIENEQGGTNTYISDLGKLIVAALEEEGYNVDLNPRSLKISWGHLIKD